MKFNSLLTNFVSKDLTAGKIPMLLGEPGIGKSSWTEALAKSMQTQCFTLAVNQLADKADLTGARLVPTGNGDNYKQVFYPHEVIMDAVEYANSHPRENPILFLDEINRTTADVTSAALSIPTMRRIGSIKLPANLRVMIAGNDKGNITSLDEASISRFVIYRTEPDTQTFLDLRDDINPFIKNALAKNPTLIFCKSLDVTGTSGNNDDEENETELSIDDIISDGDGMHQITTPRTIMSLSDWLNLFTKDEIIQLIATPAVVDGINTNALMEGIIGHAGYTNFAICVENEIRNGINTMNTTTASKTPKMPVCYKDLKSQPDMNKLQTFVDSMTEAELSASIVYAIYEKVDNKMILLTMLKNSNSKLLPEDMTMMMNLIAAEDYDTENWETLIESNTAIGNIFKMYANI